MTEHSLAQLRTPKTPKESREQRGLDLFRERGEEIRRVRRSVWAVPSCSGSGVYLADVAGGVCTCPDTPPAGEYCKHVHAATVARSKTALCDGCRRRFLRRELVELIEGNHDDLTYFHGDQLCRGCALDAGVLS